MSAARYTNKIRTDSEARVRKVQYRYNDAHNYNPIAAACAASPDFAILSYVKGVCCSAPNVPAIIVYFLDGGNAYTNVYDEGYPPPTYLNILQDTLIPPDLVYNGGSANVVVFTPIYNSGSASDNFPNILQDILVLSSGIILDSGSLITLQNPIYDGGSASSVTNVVLDGGNSVPL
jgi:hypothetical protein